jgi:integrase
LAVRKPFWHTQGWLEQIVMVEPHADVGRSAPSRLGVLFPAAARPLGPEHIRQYQAHLFRDRKLGANTVAQRVAALFFYIRTLGQEWSLDRGPYPKRPRQLPDILCPQEVDRLINAADSAVHRIIVMTLYATGVRRAELTQLRIQDIDSERMVVHVHGGKGRKDR